MEPQDPKPPRPRQPSKPELPKASVDKTVGVASEDQRRFDLPKRSATLTGMPAPAAPGSVPPPTRPPVPARGAAPWGKTMRAPTPPEVMAQARREPPPLPAPASPGAGGDQEPAQNETLPASLRKPSPLPAPSQRPEDGRLAAQAREIDRLRSERNAAREARAAAEQAANEARDAAAEAQTKASEAPAAAEAVSNEAIGRIVREVTSSIGKKLGLPAAFVACLGGGGYAAHVANEKPKPAPLTAAQLDERLGKFESKVVGRLDTLTITQNGTIEVVRCMRKKTNQIGGSLLPAPDRMGSALKQSPYEDDCADSPKKLPEPQVP